MPRRTVNVGLRNAAIMNGDEDLTDWDDEELKRGRRRDRHGGWRGKDPKIVPKAIHDEWVSRKFARAHEAMADSLEDMVSELCEIALDPDVEPVVRLRAIEMAFDRVWGKPAVNVGVVARQEEPRWATVLAESIISLPVEPDVIETTSTEVDD